VQRSSDVSLLKPLAPLPRSGLISPITKTEDSAIAVIAQEKLYVQSLATLLLVATLGMWILVSFVGDAVSKAWFGKARCRSRGSVALSSSCGVKCMRLEVPGRGNHRR